jgi:arylformamidase
MKSIVDLTGRMENGLWGYHEVPGLEEIVPPVSVEHVASVENDGFFISKLCFATISGTYLEAGSHILKNGRTLDTYSVQELIRPVKILRLPKQKNKSLISFRILKENAPRIEKGDALIIDTGWGEMWNKPGYVVQCPNFLPEALEWVLEQEISIFGVDVPCIEASWAEDDDDAKGGILGELFKRGALLLAPLVNLDKIPEDSGTIICLPLFIEGTSGAPVRVIYICD